MKMQLILMLAAIIGVLALLALPTVRMVAKQFTHNLAINALGDGVHPDGHVTRTADAAHTLKNLIVKEGTTAGSTVAICGLNARPIGVCEDTPEAADDPVNVALLGVAPGTLLAVAAGAITAGAAVYTAANGKVSATGASTSYFLGFAVTAAAADGDPVEIAHTIALAAQA